MSDIQAHRLEGSDELPLGLGKWALITCKIAQLRSPAVHAKESCVYQCSNMRMQMYTIMHCTNNPIPTSFFMHNVISQ